jgi:hypothetical protein
MESCRQPKLDVAIRQVNIDGVTSKSDKLRHRMSELLTMAQKEEDPLHALAAARDLRALLYEWEGLLARKAVLDGASWEEIGALLGVSKQAAWTRYKEPASETPSIREARERVAKARGRKPG